MSDTTTETAAFTPPTEPQCLGCAFYIWRLAERGNDEQLVQSFKEHYELEHERKDRHEPR